MSDRKLKHLEFTQQVIARLNQNSFLIKGWSVTLTSAIIALAAKDTNPNFIFISYIAIPVFWGLDAFFLCREKRYRKLFNAVAALQDNQINFNMDASQYKAISPSFARCIFSTTVFFFHGVLFAAILFIRFVVPILPK